MSYVLVLVRWLVQDRKLRLRQNDIVNDYVLLLRGINVGGIRIAMSDLRACFQEAGFESIQTYLQTGNLRVQTKMSLEKAVDLAHRALKERFKYEAIVFGVTHAEFVNIVKSYPWTDTAEGMHRYVIFGSDPDLLDGLAQAAALILILPERVQRGTNAVYWEVAKGSTIDTPMGKLLSQSRFKKGTTTRNLNTLGKML